MPFIRITTNEKINPEQQARLTRELGEKIESVIYLNVPDEEIIKRTSGRLICSDCQTTFHKLYNPPKTEGVCDKCGGKLYVREDDKPETVAKRLEVFHSTTLPLVDFYKQKGFLVEIDPDLSPKGAVADMRELSRKLGLLA